MKKNMKTGRPPMYKTPEQMQERIDAYFEEQCFVDEKGIPGEIPNVLDLVVFLGFAERQSLKDYSKRSEAFSYTIKRAKARIYNAKMQLAMRGVINPTIFIFDAVNNHGMVNTRSENKNDTKLTRSKGGPIPVEVVWKKWTQN